LKKQRPPDRQKAALWAFCFSLASFSHRFIKSRDRASLGPLAAFYPLSASCQQVKRPPCALFAPRVFSRAIARYCTRIARFLARIARFARFQSQKRGIFARFPASSSTFQIARVELIFRAAVKL
jgi:hypothetical protein